MLYISVQKLITRTVQAVHNAEGEESSVAVSSIGHFHHGRQVVHEVELCALLFVKPGQQQVHHVRRLWKKIVNIEQCNK